jgi:hypothetical protein
MTIGSSSRPAGVNRYRNIAGDPDRIEALDHELADLARRHDRGAGAMDWEYLLFTARKASS